MPVDAISLALTVGSGTMHPAISVGVVPVPRGPAIESFADKLRLAMGFANLSRAQLAQAVGVDKSIIARWLAGTLRPGDYTLTALTQALAGPVPGLRRADWDLSAAAFAARLGLPAPILPSASVQAASPDRPLDVAASRMAGNFGAAARSYAGTWIYLAQVTRDPSWPLGIMGWAALLRPAPDGAAIEVHMGHAVDGHARGSLIALGSKLYIVVVQDARPDAVTFYTLNGVTTDRAMVLDGMVMSRDRTTEAAATAYRTFFFRMGDATDDAALADARRRIAALNEIGLTPLVPAPVMAAFTADEVSTASPSRIRLAAGRSWSCNAQELAAPGFRAQAEALAGLRALFEAALTPA